MSQVINQKMNKARRGPFRFHRLGGVSAAAILIVILAALFVLSFGLGRYSVSPGDVIKILASLVLPIDHTWRDALETIVLHIRLPRILAAMLIGGSLALAGTSFQGLFRNPLVSPDILGVSAGAGFGAALAILLNADNWGIQISAFFFALLAVGIAFTVSRLVKGNPMLSLILAGMAIGSLFGALLSLAKYVADPIDQLPAITFWLMGSLAGMTNHDLLFAAIPMLAGITVLILIRWRFNVLAMGEEEAQALGVDTGKLRIIIVICCTLVSASAVCISGIIGWVGLVIPHIGRMLVGPNHNRLMPVSLLLGAVYLLFIDNIARAAISVEIPIGILTAIVGAPFFIYLLNRGGKGWA
ncbi:MAG: iron ABC transporter permease [Dehalococcoidales bacterium]|nr:iron ABC transporter permease [Dehalococcoidales bacterium]